MDKNNDTRCGTALLRCAYIMQHKLNINLKTWHKIEKTKGYGVTIQSFTKFYYDQVVKALDSQSRGPVFKTTGWFQGRLSI